MIIKFSFSPHGALRHLPCVVTDQGQGGGQSVEDAEALGAFFAGCTIDDAASVPQLVKAVEQVRMERASKIQGFSREKALGARPGDKFTLNGGEFVPYNFSYPGAVKWAEKLGLEVPEKAKKAASASHAMPNGKGVSAPDATARAIVEGNL